MRIWMPPGEYLRQCRKAEGMSQRKLAHRVGLSHVFIGAVERGEKRFPLDRCREFALALPWTFKESEMRRLHPWGDLSHRWGHEWAAVAWMAAAELEVATMVEEHVPRMDGGVDDSPPLSFARAEIESWLT